MLTFAQGKRILVCFGAACAAVCTMTLTPNPIWISDRGLRNCWNDFHLKGVRLYFNLLLLAQTWQRFNLSYVYKLLFIWISTRAEQLVIKLLLLLLQLASKTWNSFKNGLSSPGDGSSLTLKPHKWLFVRENCEDGILIKHQSFICRRSCSANEEAVHCSP